MASELLFSADSLRLCSWLYADTRLARCLPLCRGSTDVHGPRAARTSQWTSRRPRCPLWRGAAATVAMSME